MRLRRGAVIILAALLMAGGMEGSKPRKRSKSAAKPRTESRADLQRQQKAAQKEIAETRQKIVQNEKEVSRTLSDLGKLEGDIAASRKLVASSRQQVTALQSRITGLQSNITAGEKELARLREEYLKSVKAIRAKKGGNSELVYLFSAGSLGEGRRRMRYLREFREWRDRQTSDIKAKVNVLKTQKEQLTTSKQQHDKALATQLAAQNSLEGQYRQKDALVTELRANGEALRTHLAKKQVEANALRSRVAALIAAEQAEAERKAAAERAAAERKAAAQRAAAEKAAAEKAAAERAAAEKAEAEKAAAEKNVARQEKKTKKKKEEPARRQTASDTKSKKQEEKQSGGEYAQARKRRPKNAESKASAPAKTQPQKPAQTADPAASGFASMKGSLPRPVSGAFRVTSYFGVHSLPDLPDVKYDNPGIDAEVGHGASAVAVYGGKVSGVYMIPGYGTVVIVSHGNYYTVYGNLTSAMVKVGDVVKQGQGVGSVADSEDNPGHGLIHFEVWHNREKQNPLSWIR